MMVCITARAAGIEAPIETGLAHAPFFVFIETETGEVHSVANALCGGRQGAGPRAARFVAEYGSRAVVTGWVGAEAAQVLRDAGITLATLTGEQTVTEALEAFRAGLLRAGTPPGPARTDR